MKALIISIMMCLSFNNNEVATMTDATTSAESQTASTEQSDVAAPFDLNADEGAEVLNPIVDENLYLSKEYSDKDINDCYSMLLSIRNCVILLIMTIFLFKAYEIMSREFKKHFKA